MVWQHEQTLPISHLHLLATDFHRIIPPFSSITRATGFLLSKKEDCIFSPGYFIG